MQRLYLCTQNHGHHAGITDLVTMLRNGTRDAGFDAMVSDVVEPGHCNVLIENFKGPGWGRGLAEVKRVGTRYVLVCTEILTGSSFNRDLVPGDPTTATTPTGTTGTSASARWRGSPTNSGYCRARPSSSTGGRSPTSRSAGYAGAG